MLYRRHLSFSFSDGNRKLVGDLPLRLQSMASHHVLPNKDLDLSPTTGGVVLL
jgi:hypothetical protein